MPARVSTFEALGEENQLAAQVGSNTVLVVTPPEQRLIWFEGDDAVMGTTENWQRAELEGAEWSVDLSARPLNPRVYFAFAEKNQADAEALLDALKDLCLEAEIELLHDGMILSGENIANARAAMLQRSDLTIQLLSPGFFADGLGERRTPQTLPVLLHELAAKDSDTKIFRHAGKSFDACRAPRDP